MPDNRVQQMGENPRPAWKYNCNDCGAHGRAYWPVGTEKPNGCPNCDSPRCGLERVRSPEEHLEALGEFLVAEFWDEVEEKEDGSYENETELAIRLLREMKERRRDEI